MPLATPELVLPLYEEGLAFLAQTPRDLLNILMECRNFEVSADVSEWFFKKDALENIKRELRLLSIY